MSDAAEIVNDDGWNQEARGETPTQRLDRNFIELIQELRVIQTGVQILTGFLLTLPFQQRFSMLDSPERAVYLIAVSASVTATAFLATPVAIHRALFRQHRRSDIVRLAHAMAIIGMASLSCAIVSVVLLIFQVLLGWGGGLAAGGVCAAMLLTLWLIVPLTARHRAPEPDDQEAVS
ncbi:MAG TPA: DUF6328 family protein [Jatrophihabitans sp.]|jgi:hypothetical protein|nr:DUF6328 family protein [Jatrophihabitans sp.]